MPTALTFLFTDLEDSTALWEQAPTAMHAALGEHDAITVAAVQNHKGRVVKTTGDGFHAVFHSTLDAVLAALAAQQAMAHHIWPLETGPLKVRMGLHTGASEERDGDYFGTTVNMAARIMSLGHGGQVLLSEDTVNALRNQQIPGINFSDLGAYSLKGLSQPTVIYQLNHPALDSDFAPLKSPSLPRHNLPPQPTPFIGRSQELEEINRLLQDPACRLLTLVGPGGIGKTRLALEAAAHIVEAFSDGVQFVPLAPVSEVDLIISATAEALKLNFRGKTDPRSQLLHHLSRKNYLLVLDNFEHLLSPHEPRDARGSSGGEELISELLSKVPHLKIMITSRELLKLQEEWRYEVPGMPYPPSEILASGAGWEDPEEYEAVRLFLNRARKADANFSYTAGDLHAVVHICRLLGGLPLGIELAAPWVRLMSIQDIAAELEHSLDLLTTSLRNVPERHRSMRIVLQQTWQQLSAEERASLSKLSIFRGGCLRDAAEFVAGTTMRQLLSLVDKALLRRNSSGRYDLHELIRQFALEQLQQTPSIYSETVRHHYRYYVGFLQQHLGGLKGGAQLAALRLITADIDNVRSAWGRAVEARDWVALEQAAEALCLYSELEGALTEGEAALRQAADTFGSGPEATKPTALALKGFLLAGQGSLLAHLGELKEGQALLEQGLALLQDARDDNRSIEKRALALQWLGWVHFLLAENEKVEEIIQESLALHTAIDHQWGIAKCLSILGNSRTGEGLLDEAEPPLRQSLSLSEELGDRRSQLLAAWNLAILSFWFGDYAQTGQLLADAVSLGQELDDKIGLALALKERGKLQVAYGEYQQALQDLRESIAITTEIGSHWESAATLDDLGVTLCLMGDYEEAERAIRQCLAASEARQHRYFIARCLGDLGLLALHREQTQLAGQYLQQALDIWTGLGHEPYTAWVLCQLGHVRQAAGAAHFAEASANYKSALELSLGHRLAPFAMETFVGAAKLLIAKGARQRAISLLSLSWSHPATTAATRKMVQAHFSDIDADQWSDADPKKWLDKEQEWQAAASGMLQAWDQTMRD